MASVILAIAAARKHIGHGTTVRGFVGHNAFDAAEPFDNDGLGQHRVEFHEAIPNVPRCCVAFHGERRVKLAELPTNPTMQASAAMASCLDRSLIWPSANAATPVEGPVMRIRQQQRKYIAIG